MPRIINHSLQQGFSLIELSICVALIAFIGTLCVPALLNHTTQSVRVEALLFKTTCWYLQQKARAINAPITLKINPIAGSYTFNNQTHLLSPQVKFSGPAITFADNTIIFYPQGTQSSGSVYFSDQRGQTQYALTAAVAGVPYVRMYHLIHNNWQLCT